MRAFFVCANSGVGGLNGSSPDSRHDIGTFRGSEIHRRDRPSELIHEYYRAAA
jgi:hypothetical protein